MKRRAPEAAARAMQHTDAGKRAGAVPKFSSSAALFQDFAAAYGKSIDDELEKSRQEAERYKGEAAQYGLGLAAMEERALSLQRRSMEQERQINCTSGCVALRCIAAHAMRTTMLRQTWMWRRWRVRRVR